jgi:hypothetical protein
MSQGHCGPPCWGRCRGAGMLTPAVSHRVLGAGHAGLCALSGHLDLFRLRSTQATSLVNQRLIPENPSFCQLWQAAGQQSVSLSSAGCSTLC